MFIFGFRSGDAILAMRGRRSFKSSDRLGDVGGIRSSPGWDFFVWRPPAPTLSLRKPNAAPLLEAIGRAGGGPGVLVGDSIVDIQTALAAGLPSIAVTFGFRDRPAEDLGATGLIEHFDQLVPVLETLKY